MSPRTIVLKFGGASVATPKHFERISDLILGKLADYQRVAVVVSAMGDMTDQLIKLSKEVNENPPRREYDMLVTVGERISVALLAMALDAKGQEAISFTGSQAGIITTTDHTDAKIVEVKPFRLWPHLEKGKVVIVAGFQGVSKQGEITTLGRGGSDTTAVALGVALGAEKVEFFKDVAGIYNEDPKKNTHAQLIEKMSYDEALKTIRASKKQVLHERCIGLAQKNALPLRVLSFDSALQEKHPMGTEIRDEKLSKPASPAYEDEA